MTRRRLLSLGLPAAALAALGGYASWRRGANPYYAGPVTDHFDGVRFLNPDGEPPSSFGGFLRWQTAGGREAWPEAYPSPFRDRPPARSEAMRVALVGHASFLIQVAGANLLTDPVWSERASPVQFAGPRRVQPPGVAFDDLPEIDAVLLTHNHYDHLDLTTLSRLAATRTPRVIAPLGNDAILKGHDGAIHATAHDWGERVAITDRVTVALEPAHHWSARGALDRRMALWCAFAVLSEAGTLYHCGDSGYFGGRNFRAARERFGAFAHANLPIGAYEPRWFMRGSHMNPEEAVAAMADLGARTAAGHHWGTFRLTNEGIERPVEALAAAREAAGVPPERFRALRPGEAWEVGAG